MNEQSKYWLDQAAAEIIKKYPDGDIVISSGISPSASYHIGHFREILTIDALAWALRQAGRRAIHKHVVDNFDPLRKRYSFLPESYEQWVGVPICFVPDPFDACRAEHQTYAEHFYQEFEQHARAMGIGGEDFQVIRSYEDLYKPGKMAEQIEKVIAKKDQVRQIFKEVSDRDLPEDWVPLQLLGPNKSYTELRYQSIDTAAHTIVGVDEAGGEHELHYDQGEVKLNWRLDWPARWQVLGVMVEPFSAQEHGAAGGSYDTGTYFSREIFGYEPPLPAVQYGNIHLVGENTKMSSSKGNLVTPGEALQIMPPEVLRYFIVRSKPDRTLFFDPGLGFYNLVDEYSKIAAGEKSDFKEAYEFATAISTEPMIAKVPFNHLVSSYQTGRGDTKLIKDTLRRTGHEFDDAALEREIPFVKNWLEKYAPDSVKFTVQDKLPDIELSDEQKKFLADLSGRIDGKELDGQAMHEAIYAAKDSVGLQPHDAFQALYRVILNQDRGPKAGWFLASLDQKWLLNRLKLQS